MLSFATRVRRALAGTTRPLAPSRGGLGALTLVPTVVLLWLLAVAQPVLAAAPATVTVRVEGLAETRLLPTQVTTTTTPFSKDGNPEHVCPGTSALGALQLATAGNWAGPWNSEFKQYEIYSIEGETHLFEKGAPANYYWSFWLDEREAALGACEAQLQPGDRVLFFPACFGASCPAPSAPLEIEAPPSANVGEAVSVTVKRYSPSGQASPAAGASVTGGGAGAIADSSGHATLIFPRAGTVTLQVTAAQSVRTEAAVCVHAGNDGSCGTQFPSGSASASAGAGPRPIGVPYTGPYALVARAAGPLDRHVYSRVHAPRVLAGTVSAHTAVSSVSIELHRKYRGRCFAYSGLRAVFVRSRCGRGEFFEVSRTSSFSYLLPFALPPGRYVLDIEATDASGDRTRLARGTSRIVFYVR